MKAWQISWRIKNPIKSILIQAKKRARDKGLEFNIDESDIKIPELCPILGFPIKFNYGKTNCDDSISLDRIDPSKGYIKGNVHVISNRANVLKRNATLKEIKQLANYLETLS